MVAECVHCNLVHLEQSWIENDGCTTYGCQSGPTGNQAAAPAAPSYGAQSGRAVITPGSAHQHLPEVGYAGPILLTICLCLIGGIIAIVMTGQVNSAAQRGDVEEYHRLKSSRSNWIIASVILGILANIIFIAAQAS